MSNLQQFSFHKIISTPQTVEWVSLESVARFELHLIIRLNLIEWWRWQRQTPNNYLYLLSAAQLSKRAIVLQRKGAAIVETTEPSQHSPLRPGGGPRTLETSSNYHFFPYCRRHIITGLSHDSGGVQFRYFGATLIPTTLQFRRSSSDWRRRRRGASPEGWDSGRPRHKTPQNSLFSFLLILTVFSSSRLFAFLVQLLYTHTIVLTKKWKCDRMWRSSDWRLNGAMRFGYKTSDSHLDVKMTATWHKIK